ncbi:hypothetical protein FQP88_12240 [Vibrio atlanticus]|nr:hypothetical protein FQP88_12240 [Vibrio atlanticus]
MSKREQVINDVHQAIKSFQEEGKKINVNAVANAANTSNANLRNNYPELVMIIKKAGTDASLARKNAQLKEKNEKLKSEKLSLKSKVKTLENEDLDAEVVMLNSKLNEAYRMYDDLHVKYINALKTIKELENG